MTLTQSSGSRSTLAALMLVLSGCLFLPAPKAIVVTIRGQVVDKHSGLQVAGRIVDIFEFRPRKGPFRIGAMFVHIAEAVTDQDGRFEVEVTAQQALYYGERLCSVKSPIYAIRREDYKRNPTQDVMITFKKPDCDSL